MGKIDEIKLPYFFIQWHVTSRCNLACKHCYGGYGDTKEKEFTFDECVKIIKEYSAWIKELGTEPWIHFTGGEPLLREDLFDLIKVCREEGIKVRVLTNGTMLKQFVPKLVQHGVSSISIGFDHYQEAEFDAFRGQNGCFNAICQGIRAAKEQGLKVIVGPTVSKFNIDCIEQIYELASNLGVDEFHIHRLVCLGRANENEETGMVSQAEMKKIIELLYAKHLENGSTKVSIGGTLWPIMDDFTELGGCIVGYTGLAVLTDGTVYPCRLLPISLGNVREKSLKEIFLLSDVLKKSKERCLEGKCGDCRYKISCGGCRALAYASSGNYLHEDPQCWVG